ncbi:MAG: DUF5131 family protein [Ignavibacteriaceae bacterium]
MAENSKIEWCDHTVNLWWGCSKVHAGCKNCYAESLSIRYGNDIWGEDKQRKLIQSAFKDLNKYQKQAQKENKVVKVFMGSMMDIFEESKPLIGLRERYVCTGTLRELLFTEILQDKYPNLIFLFLTKRPKNIIDLIPYEWKNNTPGNVWFGTSISDQDTKKYVEKLKLVLGSNLFLSIEPQIGLIDNIDLNGIDWVIQGGESGNKKRPFQIEWAERMKQICYEQNTPFFFKQIDKVQSIPDNLMIKQYPDFNGRQGISQ